jgi:hypothetical protein
MGYSNGSNGKNPGEDVDEIRHELSHEKCQSIRKQLATIHQEVAGNEIILTEQHPSFFRYDSENDKL